MQNIILKKNETGIVAMITNNSFIDGITHRQMRKHLLETFDEIYVLDLHGNSKKKEKAPDGGKDENVFDIMQGVAISIFIRKNSVKKNLGIVYHSDIYGKRKNKFKELKKSGLNSIKWKKLDSIKPYYFFVPKDFSSNDTYEKGFKFDGLFKINSNGIETQKDAVNIFFSLEKAIQTAQDFISLPENELKIKYELTEGRDWKIKAAKEDLIKNQVILQSIQHRPFDYRYTNYTGKTKGIMAYPRFDVMQHLCFNNIGLIVPRQTSQDYRHSFVTKLIVEGNITASAKLFGTGSVFPLYLYSEDGTKTPNLKTEIVNAIEKIVGKVKPEDILDYIYAVLHSPSYREKYKDFLKIDFPRIPYPKDKITFKKLVKLGTELRKLHLLESPKVNSFITTYPVSGSNEVEKLSYEDGKVYINKDQYFGKVPQIAWSFYIGGYQPAQKWLKDRKRRTLTNNDIEHYQKIIVALSETDRLMKEIDIIIQY